MGKTVICSSLSSPRYRKKSFPDARIAMLGVKKTHPKGVYTLVLGPYIEKNNANHKSPFNHLYFVSFKTNWKNILVLSLWISFYLKTYLTPPSSPSHQRTFSAKSALSREVSLRSCATRAATSAYGTRGAKEDDLGWFSFQFWIKEGMFETYFRFFLSPSSISPFETVNK